MIRLEQVTKRFGSRTLFEGISWELTPGKRFGLVGPNGAGKTTLFKVLTQDTEIDEGRVLIPNGMTVGLLPQSVGEMSGGTVMDRILDTRKDVLAYEEELETLQKALENVTDPDEAMELSERYGALEELYRHAGGYTIRTEAKSILAGMGFTSDDFDRDVTEFSGGWRMRIVLAGLLLLRPSVLLMDEPTNHLDVPSLEWLEGFLANYEGTVVLISHDRFFLNRLVSHVASIESNGLFITTGNYDAFEKAKAFRAEERERLMLQQSREIAKVEEFIAKFRYTASKAKQVQSRVKQLEKIERIEAVAERRSVSMRFPDAPRSGKIIATAKGVDKAYDDNVIYKGLDFQIDRGERIAFVGPNGQGKSTLLKMLADRLTPDSGTVELGHNVVPGYFAQHHIDGMNLDSTILEEMESRATNESFPRCRSILGAFLFSGDDVKKRIRVLSGGEKHRVALATLLLRPSNLLLLDEPTNHLDMESRDVLKAALRAYQGTVVFVSHDRTFLNGLATRMVHIERQTVTNYLGDYDYYHDMRELEKAEAEGAKVVVETTVAEKASAGETLSRKDQRRLAAERRKERKHLLGDRDKRFKTLEANIEAFEAERVALGKKLADPSFYENPGSKEYADVSRKHADLESKLAKVMKEWERLGDEIERAEIKLNAKFGEA